MALDDVKDDHGGHHDREEREAHAPVITQYRRYGTAKEIACSRQKQDPDAAAQSTQAEKSWKGHPPNSVEDAHRDAYSVDVLRNDNGRVAKLVDDLFDTRLCHLIKTIVLRIFVKYPSDSVAEAIANDPAKRAEDYDL